MTIREAHKQQRESIKNRSPKEKLSYFWEYYGIKTIALALALITCIAFVISIATQKEYALTGVFFGAVPQDSAESYLQEFGQEAGIDFSRQEISVQCHLDIQMDQAITQEIYTSMETFTAMIAANTLDCFAGSQELMLYFAYMEYATDLRDMLTPQELEQLTPYLYYIDRQLIRQQEANDEGYANAYAQHPDPTKPEAMAEPVPVAVSLKNADPKFLEAYKIDENYLFSICVTAPYPQNALAFLRYCLK